VVVHHHATFGYPAIHQIVGRVDPRAIGETPNGETVAAADAVAAPVAAGGQHHVFGAEVEHVLRGERRIEIDGYIRELVDLARAPVAHARPFGQAGQARFTGHAPAQFLACFGQAHRVTTLAQRARGLQPGRTGTYHQHAGRRAGRRDALRVPALAPFLAHGGVLRAADRRDRHVAGDADVAADAFADVVDAAFLDLARQERIGDRRACAADQVQHAAPELRHHGVGRGEAAHADHRFAGGL